MLDMHLDRLESSLRILFPGMHLAFDGDDGHEERVDDVIEISDSHNFPYRLLDEQDQPHIFFASDAEKAGVSPSEQKALSVQSQIGGNIMRMNSTTFETDAARCRTIILIVECDPTGEPVFSASKFLRGLRRSARTGFIVEIS